MERYFKEVIAAAKTEDQMKDVSQMVRLLLSFSPHTNSMHFVNGMHDYKAINATNLKRAKQTLSKYVKLREDPYSNVGQRALLRRSDFDPSKPDVINSARRGVSKASKLVDLEITRRHILNGLRVHANNPKNKRALSPQEARDMVLSMIRAEKLRLDAGNQNPGPRTKRKRT
jgi:hypothetical protein